MELEGTSSNMLVAAVTVRSGPVGLGRSHCNNKKCLVRIFNYTEETISEIDNESTSHLPAGRASAGRNFWVASPDGMAKNT